MQIDWTTFLLEILNFLVLVWILKRFLYKPVLGVLDARTAKVREQAQLAERTRKESEEMKRQYDTRLADWNREREEKRRELTDELAKERTIRLNELQQSLADERARVATREQVLSAAREKTLLHQAETKAVAAAALMLARLADAALTARIAGMLVEDLAALPEDKRAELRRAAERMEKREGMNIAAAQALDDATGHKIAKAIEQITGHEIPYRIALLPELIGGLRVSLGECVLHANLADELAFFHPEEKHG